MKKLLFILLLPLSLFAQTPDATIKTNTNNLIRNATNVTRANHSLINDQITDSKESRIQPFIATGTNTYTVTIPYVTSYLFGLTIPIQFLNANSGASTINITGSSGSPLGAKSLKKSVTTDLTTGDILANESKVLWYDGTNFQVRNIAGSGGGGGGGGGGGYTVAGSAPVDTSVSWVDSGNAYAGMFPVRRYIDGAWEPINPNMDYYDPIGDITSRGKPLLVGVAGQSNTATAFNRDYLGSKDAGYLSTSSTSINTATTVSGTVITATIGTGLSWSAGRHVNFTSSGTPAEFINGKVTSYNSGTGVLIFTVIFPPVSAGSYTDWIVTRLFPGDYEKDNRITLWNADANAWVVPDFLNQAASGTGTANNWSWNLCLYGANNIQTFAKDFIKATGRAVRIVQWREGGTPIAYWEKDAAAGGFPGWVALNNEMISSGVSDLDLFIFIQGEGGLNHGPYTSQYSTYYEALHQGLTKNIRAAAWGKPETVFIMPSIATGMEQYPVDGTTSPSAEYAIRSLSDGNNLYNAWAQGNNQKSIRVPTAGEGLFITSSTSVNVGTLGSSVTITLPTSLPTFPSPVWVVSRANNNNRFRGDIVSYTFGTGALVLNNVVAYGTGTFTDWDVLPQDSFHLTSGDNVSNGHAIYNAYSNISLRKLPITIQTTDPGTNNILRVKTTNPPSDLTEVIYQTRQLNSGTPLSLGFGGGGSPTSKILAVASGGNSEVDIVFAAKTGNEATIADEAFRVAHYGTKMLKPLYWRYTGAPSLDSRIGLTTSPLSAFGLDIIGGTTGNSDAITRIVHGGTEAFRAYEGGGNGFENVFQRSLVAQDNTTEKTRRATENRVGLFSSSLTASSTLTSTVYQNAPITSIDPYTAVHVEVEVMGLVNDASQAFYAKGSALFRISTYGNLVLGYSGPVEISDTGIISGLTFSVVSGQISATLTRGATVGDFRVSSVTKATLKTY